MVDYTFSIALPKVFPAHTIDNPFTPVPGPVTTYGLRQSSFAFGNKQLQCGGL